MSSYFAVPSTTSPLQRQALNKQWLFTSRRADQEARIEMVSSRRRATSCWKEVEEVLKGAGDMDSACFDPMPCTGNRRSEWAEMTQGWKYSSRRLRKR
eukprot:767537-Hanusia_phi.AAC.6